VLCIGGVLLSIIASFALATVTAYLLVHPLAHELLTGSLSALVTAGAYVRDGRMLLVVAVGAGMIGAVTWDGFYWWAGRRYGDRLIRSAFGAGPQGRNAIGGPQGGTRNARRVERGERFVARWGVWAVVVAYFQPIPNSLLYAAVGASGVGLLPFALADVAGSLLWVGLLVGLGYAIGRPAVHAAQAVSHDALLITVVLVVVVIVVSAVRARREQA
jgi:membrane protein DedA with SNARE-associated domain